MSVTEKGYACIVIELNDGVIGITHGESGELLLEADVYQGFWDEMWEWIESNSRVTFRPDDLQQ